MVNQKVALVVDDEPQIVEDVSEALKEDLHYLVVSATDPQDAVKYATNFAFDLLIVDLLMPKLDGFKVIDLVRAKHPKVKTIIITGHSEEYGDKYKQIKVDLKIQKPIGRTELTDQVVRVAGAVDVTQLSHEGEPIPKARILIVDDESEVGDFLKEFLLDDDPNEYEIELAKDGKEGLVMANQFRPDIVLVDIKMPAMRGDEMITRIREGNGFKPKQFIIITAVTDQETIDKYAKDDVPYFTKPFDDIENLKGRIRKTCIKMALTKAH